MARGWRTFLSETVAPVVLLVLVNMIFSGYVVLAKASLSSGTSPEVFALLRDLVACALFLPTLYAVERRKPASTSAFLPRQEHWGLVIALGVLGVFGAQLLGSISLSYLSSATYGLLSPTTPIVTLLVSLAVGIDTVNVRAVGSWVKLAGVAVTVGGAFVIVYFSAGDAGANAPIGFAFILCQKLAQGSYPVLQKWMLSRYGYPALTLATWAYVTGTAIIAMVVLTTSTDNGDWVLTPTSLGGLFFSGVLSSYFNYGAMAWVNKKTSPLVTMAFYPLQSFGAPLLSSLFLGYTLRDTDAIGGAVVVLGLFLLVWGRHLEGGVPSSGLVARSDDAEVATIRLKLNEVTALVAAAAKSSGLTPEQLVEALQRPPSSSSTSVTTATTTLAAAQLPPWGAGSASTSVSASASGGGSSSTERTRLLSKPRGGDSRPLGSGDNGSGGGGGGGGGGRLDDAPASSLAPLTEHIMGALVAAIVQRGHAAGSVGDPAAAPPSHDGSGEPGLEQPRRLLPEEGSPDEFYDAHQPARDAATADLYRRASVALGIQREQSVLVEPPMG